MGTDGFAFELLAACCAPRAAAPSRAIWHGPGPLPSAHDRRPCATADSPPVLMRRADAGDHLHRARRVDGDVRRRERPGHAHEVGEARDVDRDALADLGLERGSRASRCGSRACPRPTRRSCWFPSRSSGRRVAMPLLSGKRTTAHDELGRRVARAKGIDRLVELVERRGRVDLRIDERRATGRRRARCRSRVLAHACGELPRMVRSAATSVLPPRTSRGWPAAAVSNSPSDSPLPVDANDEQRVASAATGVDGDVAGAACRRTSPTEKSGMSRLPSTLVERAAHVAASPARSRSDSLPTASLPCASIQRSGAKLTGSVGNQVGACALRRGRPAAPP